MEPGIFNRGKALIAQFRPNPRNLRGRRRSFYAFSG
jgi:hypothetical protein